MNFFSRKMQEKYSIYCLNLAMISSAFSFFEGFLMKYESIVLGSRFLNHNSTSSQQYLNYYNCDQKFAVKEASLHSPSP